MATLLRHVSAPAPDFLISWRHSCSKSLQHLQQEAEWACWTKGSGEALPILRLCQYTACLALICLSNQKIYPFLLIMMMTIYFSRCLLKICTSHALINVLTPVKNWTFQRELIDLIFWSRDLGAQQRVYSRLAQLGCEIFRNDYLSLPKINGMLCVDIWKCVLWA